MTNLILATLIAFSSAPPPDKPDGNLPVSRQARLKESVSANEVDLYAVGIAGGSKKYRQTAALIDARKSAVYYVLYAGSDPILRSESEKLKFKQYEQGFFEFANIQKFISYENPEFTDRVAIDKKTRLKVEKVIRVNVGRLKEDLSLLGVIETTRAIVDDIGWPNIMVIPEAPSGGDPLKMLADNPAVAQAAASIESYLTSRRYDAIVPQQNAMLGDMVSQMAKLEGIADDPQYKLALTLGSDVYITYKIDVTTRQLGGTTVAKATTAVRAFETATARLLGTETGYSQERPEPPAVVVEEAVKDAIDKVLNRIDGYWKDDRTRGLQYRLVVKVVGDFDQQTRNDFTNRIADYLDNNCAQTKENVLSASTLDFLVWAKRDQFDKSRKLADALATSFNNAFKGGELFQVTVNRKLILLELKKKG